MPLKCLPISFKFSERYQGQQLMMLLWMQAQLQGDRNALSRPAFARMAHDERCQLYFPMHGDQVTFLFYFCAPDSPPCIPSMADLGGRHCQEGLRMICRIMK